MSGTGQLDLLDVLERPRARRPRTSAAAIGDLLCADPSHAREREAIYAAMLADARAHSGHVDPNRVRARVPAWCSPRVVSALYGNLARSGWLERGPWTVNTDENGRNAGKPLRTYYLLPACWTDKDGGQ